MRTSILALTSLLTLVPACDPESSTEPRAAKAVPLALGSSALVCVTADRPDDLDEDQLEDVYQAWIDTAEHRPQFVDSMLFQLEDGETYMFALVFDGDGPDGMEAAQRHRDEELLKFRQLLRDEGFENISPQSNLRYVGGGEFHVHFIY